MRSSEPPFLTQLPPDRLLVTGWATDICVDATVRAAVELGHKVVVAADAHTVSDRPGLDAPHQPLRTLTVPIGAT